jgi:hypothetical protein
MKIQCLKKPYKLGKIKNALFPTNEEKWRICQSTSTATADAGYK